MKTPPKRIMLVCSILILGLECSAAGPKESRRGATASTQTPDTTFNDNVTIDTSSNPALTLKQNTAMGSPAQRWAIFGGSLFGIQDLDTGSIPFAIRTNGNVGLGTFTPAEVLHIARSFNPAIRLEQTSASFARTWNILANENGFVIGDQTAGTFPFRINAGTGSVGIGTSAPAGRLHVNGTGAQLSIFQSSDNDAVQFRLQTNSINRRFVALNTAGQQQSQLLFGDSGAFDFLGPTASDVRMRFLANGNVGIGTTAPDQKLSVNGNASKPGGGSWTTFSDERLKNIKGEYTSGLDAVLKLTPIRYEYKSDNAVGIQSEGEHIGFGAQEVQKIIPEAVIQNSDGYLMVDNDPILWAMLNAIKEQNAQNAELKAQLKAQGQKIARLEGREGDVAQLKEQLERLQAQIVLQAANQEDPPKPALTEAKR